MYCSFAFCNILKSINNIGIIYCKKRVSYQKVTTQKPDEGHKFSSQCVGKAESSLSMFFFLGGNQESGDSLIFVSLRKPFILLWIFNFIETYFLAKLSALMSKFLVNPFVPNTPFLYRLFSGGRARVHWERMA